MIKPRLRANESLGQDVRWTAIIVENVRVDGQPRSLHVASLANITESRLEGKGSIHARRATLQVRHWHRLPKVMRSISV
jgi:hypothetical protein